MTNNLPSVPEKAKAAWRIVKAAGPLLIAQSMKLSEAYAQHQLRLAEVEAIKELMIGEARTIAEVRKKLIDRYFDAAPEDRLRLRQDIEVAERDLRQLGVYQKAIEHVPENAASSPQPSTAENLEPSDDFKAWLDTFNDYARKQNEPWRAELLARALALESSSPGALGQRALWFIGTIDEKSFHAFAALLDIAPNIGGSYVIPNFQPFVERPIPTCVLGPNTHLGNILFLLGDLGLIGDILTSQKIFVGNNLVIAAYGPHMAVTRTKEEMRLRGIVLTSLGDILARLYEPKSNNLGVEIYTAWLADVRPGLLEVLHET